MHLSERSNALPASPIRKLIHYTEAAVRAGKTVYHVNIGQPDIETPAPVLDAIRYYSGKILAYGTSKGMPSLREAISEYFHRLSISVDPEEVSITEGASEATLFAYSCITDPDDEIIVFEPYYANFNGFASTLNVKLVPITLSVEDDFSLPSAEVIESKITPRTRAIQINSPNNPTGKTLDEGQLKMIVDIAVKHDLFIISDEVYREFCYENQRAVSILEFDELGDRGIVLDSISKRFSACGARIGALITRNVELRERALKYGQLRLSPSILGQIGAEAAYRMDPSYFGPIREEYRRRRNTVVEMLNSIDGVSCPKPGGSFYVVAKFPIDDAEDFAKFLLADFDMDGETVMVAPASGFYCTPGLGKNEIRIAYVLEVDKLKRAMTILEEGIKAYQQKTALAR